MESPEFAVFPRLKTVKKGNNLTENTRGREAEMKVKAKRHLGHDDMIDMIDMIFYSKVIKPVLSVSLYNRYIKQPFVSFQETMVFKVNRWQTGVIIVC